MIGFKMGDWRTNVSILGLMNILDHSNLKYDFSEDKQNLLIENEVLENFEKYYFSYFIDTYEKFIPWYRIANYKDNVEEYLNNLSEFDEAKLKDLNNQIDVVKDYMRRKNYIKVYELIDKNIDIEGLVKNLNKINLKKGEELKDKLEEIELELNKLNEIIKYVNTDRARDYMGAKGVIYSYINRGIDGVSFLFRQTKEKDIFIDYKNYFIKPLEEYLSENKEKYKFECFSCGSKIKNLSINMNLVKNTGFDSSRKTSNIWNHESDFAICQKCQFLYSCLSAGFFYFMNEGIFVNYNFDLEGLKIINNNLKENAISEINRPENAISYRTLISTIEKQYERHARFELNDIQIVRYIDDRYKFNILSKEALKIIVDSRADINYLVKAGYRDGSTNFSIYDLVIDKVFNNQNLYSLIHFLIVHLISEGAGFQRFYNIHHISRILNINSRIIREEEFMTVEKERGKLTDLSKNAGYHLRKNYMDNMKDEKRVNNRMKSVTYKMLNALKTNNSGSFMDTLINTYAYVGKPIPIYLVEALKSDDGLRIVGYAFVTGINSYDDRKNDGGEDNDK